MARHWIDQDEPVWHDEIGQLERDQRTLADMVRTVWAGIRRIARDIRAGREDQR